MGKVINEGVTPSLAKFIAKQPVFFVATASNNASINVSPKSPGYSLQVLGPWTVAYSDLTGSGSETAAHILENSRITLLFVNLDPDSPPRLMRIHGTARIVLPLDAKTSGLLDCFPQSLTTDNPGWRAIYVVSVARVSTSCGYSMPKMRFEAYRTTLDEVVQAVEKRGTVYEGGTLPGGMKGYRQLKNSYSIDGLPSISLFRDTAEVAKRVPVEGYFLGLTFQAGDEKELEKTKNAMKELKLSHAILKGDDELVSLSAVVAKNRMKLPLLPSRDSEKPEPSPLASKLSVSWLSLVIAFAAGASTAAFCFHGLSFQASQQDTPVCLAR